MNTSQKAPLNEPFLANIKESVQKINEAAKELTEDGQDELSIHVSRSWMDKPPYLTYSAQLLALELAQCHDKKDASSSAGIISLDNGRLKLIEEYRALEDSKQSECDLLFVQGWFAVPDDSPVYNSDLLSEIENQVAYIEGLAFGGHTEQVDAILAWSYKALYESKEPGEITLSDFNDHSYIIYFKAALKGYARGNHIEALDTLFDKHRHYFPEKAFQYLFEMHASLSILQGLAAANNIALFDEYKLSTETKFKAESESLEYIPVPQPDIDTYMAVAAIDGFIRSKNAEKIEYFLKQLESEPNTSEFYKESLALISKNDRALQECIAKSSSKLAEPNDNLIGILNAYSKKRTDIRNQHFNKTGEDVLSVENTDKYQYFHWYSKFFGGKSYHSKMKAVEALQNLLEGNLPPSHNIQTHLNILENGSLGKQLRAFIKSGEANALLTERTGKTSNIKTIKEFIEALEGNEGEQNLSSKP